MIKVNVLLAVYGEKSCFPTLQIDLTFMIVQCYRNPISPFFIKVIKLMIYKNTDVRRIHHLHLFTETKFFEISFDLPFISLSFKIL